MRLGGVGAQFWSVYVPGTLQGDAAVTATLEQIDLVYRFIRKCEASLELAVTADDVKRIFANGKMASLLGAEGGHSIASSIGVLRILYRLGVRYMTLTHNYNLPWVDSATDALVHGGLTIFGREVVREMQNLGMLVDLSHASTGAARAALEIAKAPVFSHSCAKELTDHPRNVPDDVLTRLSINGGVCMVAFVPSFVSPECREWDLALASEIGRQGIEEDNLAERSKVRAEYAEHRPLPSATLTQVADHIDHVRQVADVDHVGIGSDYDGTDQMPSGLEDVSCYPALIAELMERRWSEEDCSRLCGDNILRVLGDAEVVSRAVSP
jgi:membrane dipeptidase